MGSRLSTRRHAVAAHSKAFAEARLTKILPEVMTPAYVLDEALIRRNGERFLEIQRRTGCQINLALKGFAGYEVFDAMKPYLAGVSASSLHEAKLGSEKFGKETHLYSPAFIPSEFEEALPMVSHVVFNSFSQYEQFRPMLQKKGQGIEVGIRLNPEFSISSHCMFDPCAPFSRFGVTQSQIVPDLMAEMDGIHIHALCQQFPNALEQVMKAAEQRFGKYFHHVKWVNFGGGHHLTHPDYDVDYLCELITAFQAKYDVQVILEPGEAVVYYCGYLVASVIDVLHNDIDIALLDASAKAHAPDVLEMGQHPEVVHAGLANQKKYPYRLGGNTCQANDIFGDYSFDKPLKPGQKIVFKDMAQYTMVKNTTFNGVKLPSISKLDVSGNYHLLKTYSYDDYLRRC